MRNRPGFFEGLALDVQFGETGSKSLGLRKVLQKKIPEFMAEVAGGSRYSLTGEMVAIWATEGTGPSGQCLRFQTTGVQLTFSLSVGSGDL